MFHYVYCIENLINGKVYVGKHSTKNFDDGYMGGGTRIRHAIAKHGLENFRRHILKEFETSEEALEFEKLLVTEELVSDENTYNLTLGGTGSWHAANKFHETHPEVKALSMKKKNLKLWANLQFREKIIKRVSEVNKQRYIDGKFKAPDWTGKHHSEESKRKIGESNAIAQKGEKNSQFGTCWISHPEMKKSQRVNKGEVEGYLADGWVKGRKMKW